MLSSEAVSSILSLASAAGSFRITMVTSIDGAFFTCAPDDAAYHGRAMNCARAVSECASNKVSKREWEKSFKKGT